MKSKIVRVFLQVETFPKIDVDVLCTAFISKNILLIVFQFLEKIFLNTMFQTIKSI